MQRLWPEWSSVLTVKISFLSVEMGKMSYFKVACCICCDLNFSLVYKFSNQFNFDFPLSQSHYHNLRPRKTKIKLVWKILNQSEIWSTTYTVFLSSHLKSSLPEWWLMVDTRKEWIYMVVTNGQVENVTRIPAPFMTEFDVRKKSVQTEFSEFWIDLTSKLTLKSCTRTWTWQDQ